MLTESHKFVTAYFVDNEKNTIEVLWKDPESDAVISEYTQFNEEDSSYKYLLKFTSLDEIHENTYNRIKQLRSNYEKTLEEIAKKNGDWIDVADDSKFIERLVVMLSKEEKDIKKEDLFKFKLAVFEDPKISESENKEKKAEIRKAKTYLEIIKAIGEI